jgi:hypothetical protein
MSDRLFEGIGAPISITRNDDKTPIDPTLDSCCQREVRSVPYFQFGLFYFIDGLKPKFLIDNRLNPTANEVQ